MITFDAAFALLMVTINNAREFTTARKDCCKAEKINTPPFTEAKVLCVAMLLSERKKRLTPLQSPPLPLPPPKANITEKSREKA